MMAGLAAVTAPPADTARAAMPITIGAEGRPRNIEPRWALWREALRLPVAAAARSGDLVAGVRRPLRWRQPLCCGSGCDLLAVAAGLGRALAGSSATRSAGASATRSAEASARLAGGVAIRLPAARGVDDTEGRRLRPRRSARWLPMRVSSGSGVETTSSDCNGPVTATEIAVTVIVHNRQAAKPQIPNIGVAN